MKELFNDEEKKKIRLTCAMEIGNWEQCLDGHSTPLYMWLFKNELCSRHNYVFYDILEDEPNKIKSFATSQVQSLPVNILIFIVRTIKIKQDSLPVTHYYL